MNSPGLDDVQGVARVGVHAERGVGRERHLADGGIGADPAQVDVWLDVVVLEPGVLVVGDRPAADRVLVRPHLGTPFVAPFDRSSSGQAHS